MKQTSLARFEALAQHLIEDSFKRLFNGRLEVPEVAARLAQALEDSQEEGRVASRFVIHLHPLEFEAISGYGSVLVDELAEYVSSLSEHSGLSVPERLHIELTADPDVPRHKVKVEADRGSHSRKMNTQLFDAVSATDEIEASLKAVDAFLIFDGRRHLPLDRPMVTIGRLTDNDIVLDGPSVSRKHAQIRWRYGRFVLYDISGRGRTAVNGQPVSEYMLQPGDVISLSNALLIYGEGRDNQEEESQDSDTGTGRTLRVSKE